jgi:hypothetical protein
MLVRAPKVALLLAAALTGAACSLALMAGADFDPDVDFSRFSTFAWDEPDDRPTGDPRFDDNPFFTERLHMAIQGRLAEYGIRYRADNPDLLVHHHTTVQDRVTVIAVDRERGYEPTEFGEGTAVVQWQEGTFLVDIADAEARRIIWRGWTRTDIEKALDDPLKMTDLIYEAIRKMFELFPDTPPRAIR